MIFITSFSPNCQDNYYKSWKKYSSKIYAFQSLGDKNFQDIHNIYINMEQKRHKKLPKIYDMINVAKEINNIICIINFDIELICDDLLWLQFISKTNNGIVFCQRYDYYKNKTTAKKYTYGIDMIMINTNILDIPKDPPFVLGGCGWDWWMLYLAYKQKIPIFTSLNPVAYHKIHKPSYKPIDCMEGMEWQKKIFKKEQIINKDLIDSSTILL